MRFSIESINGHNSGSWGEQGKTLRELNSNARFSLALTRYSAIELHLINTLLMPHVNYVWLPQKLGNIIYQNAQPIPRKGKCMFKNREIT